jgi:sigma-B regulation protein RsbU (phosphoserine phosphatase)
MPPRPSNSARSAPADIAVDEDFEGDYRPAAPELPHVPDAETAKPPRKPVLFHPHKAEPNIRLEPLQLDFLLRLADALNTTLDLNTLMHRVADLVRAVIDFRIFAILLVNDRTGELRMRFQTGHTPEVERMRIKLGAGITGQAAIERRAVLVQDVTQADNYIDANPNVRSELAVPLIVKNRVVGVVDLQSEHAGYFTPEHQRLLELTASRMAIAVENARLYTRVSRQAQTLAVLNEISREITSILDLDDLLERIGQLLKRVIDFHMFTILLWNDRTEQFEHRFSSRFGERIVREHNIRLGEGIIGNAAEQRSPILAPDVRKDPRYIVANPEVRSELAVPLIYKGKVIGVIDLEHTRLHYYNEDHQTTLSTLAAQVAISIANARLYQRIHEEEQRMERDLEMARQVQLRLLPQRPPALAHAEIASRFLPARSIGGDLYDFLDYSTPESPGRICIAVGDVSGKAAPAALYAALVSGILRSLAPQHLAPALLLAALNDQLQERKLAAQYVTMLIALWDDSTRTVHIANAGSVQPLRVIPNTQSLTNAIEVKTIETEGFPLGLFAGASYEETTFTLAPGDMIVLFSDGIPDANNAEGEMFGPVRLDTLLQQHPTATDSAGQAVEAILEAVSVFQCGVEHFDDETVVVLRAHS